MPRRRSRDFVGIGSLLAPGRPLRQGISDRARRLDDLLGARRAPKDTSAPDREPYRSRVRPVLGGHRRGRPRARDRREAADRLDAEGRGTILFVDEIHRFNRGQQDAFLPHVERGTVTLVGATTENPSFELVGALLSRTRVFVLEALSSDDLTLLLRRALTDGERGLGALGLVGDDDAIATLAELADGDARRALTALEAAAAAIGAGGRLTVESVRDALQHRVARYDKSGEEHFNLISAYHKALRGSDPQGALYWLARMIEGGEDGMYIARRTVRFAVEDVGLADPQALRLAIAARDAYHFLGSPKGSWRSPRQPSTSRRRPSPIACTRRGRRR
jgi:putative ATPase